MATCKVYLETYGFVPSASTHAVCQGPPCSSVLSRSVPLHSLGVQLTLEPGEFAQSCVAEDCWISSFSFFFFERTFHYYFEYHISEKLTSVRTTVVSL